VRLLKQKALLPKVAYQLARKRPASIIFQILQLPRFIFNKYFYNFFREFYSPRERYRLFAGTSNALIIYFFSE